MKSANQTGRISLSLTLAAALIAGTACDPAKTKNNNNNVDNKTDVIEKPNNGGGDTGKKPDEVKLGNVDATFESAIGFSKGNKSAAEVKELFDRLNEEQRRELTEKSDADGRRFVTLMVSGEVNELVVGMVGHLFKHLDDASALVQIEAKTQKMNAFDIMRRNGRAAGEKAEDVHKLLALLLSKTPKRVNDLMDGTKFEAAKFNGVFTAAADFEDSKVDEFIKELSLANFDVLLDWLVVNPKVGKVTFNKFYEAGDDARKNAMHNAKLKDAVLGGKDKFTAFVDGDENEKLMANLTTDTYKLRNKADSDDIVGPMIFVVGKRLAEDYGQPNPLMNIMELGKLASKMRATMTPDEFEDFVTVKTFGAAPGETLLKALTDAGVNQNEVKVALALPLTIADITTELKAIANSPTAAGKVVSELLYNMFKSHAEDPKVASLDDLANFTVDAADIPAGPYTGALVVNDKLLHVLLRLNTNVDLFNIVDTLFKKVTDAAALVAMDGAGVTGLNLLLDPARDINLVGDHHDQIITLLVNKGAPADITKVTNEDAMKELLAAVAKGNVAEDMTKVFTGANDLLVGRIAKFSSKNEAIAKPAFNAAYTTFDDVRKAKFHNALLVKMINLDADNFIAFVTAAADWGILAGFPDASYELVSTTQMNSYKGKFAYVTLMAMMENLMNRAPGWTIEQMHDVAKIVKDVVGANYANHVSTEKFLNADGLTNETVAEGLSRFFTEPKVKYILNLADEATLTVMDVYQELNEILNVGVLPDPSILNWLYETVVTTDAKALELVKLKSGKFRFVEGLARLKITPEVNAMLNDVLTKVETAKAGAAARHAYKFKVAPALYILADNNRFVANEDTDELQTMINQLVHFGGADVVREIKSAADYVNVRDAVIAKGTAEDLQTLCQGTSENLMGNLLTWVDADSANRRPIFKAAFASGSQESRTAMGSFLAQRALANPTAIKAFIDLADDLGLKATFGDDEYKIMSHNNTIEFTGSFFYGVAGYIIDAVNDDVPGWTLADLHEVSGKMKTVLANYVDHTAVTEYDNNNDTILGLVANYVPEHRAIYALQLDTRVTNNHILAQASENMDPDTNVPGVLGWLYNAKIKDEVTATALGLAAVNGDSIVNLIPLALATAETNEVLADFIGKLKKDRAAEMIAEDGNLGPALYSVSNDRKALKEDVNELHKMISVLVHAADLDAFGVININGFHTVLDAVLAHGSTADMQKVFASTSQNMMRDLQLGLPAWAYKNRAKDLKDKATTKATIAKLYAEEYTDRAKRVATDGIFELRHGLLEAALWNHGLGDNDVGVISVLRLEMLPHEALTQDYRLFGVNDSVHTVLYSTLHQAVQLVVAEAIKPLDNTDNRFNDAATILRMTMDGATADEIKVQVNNDAIANAGMTALARALDPVVVKNFALALGRGFDDDGWDDLCGADDNGPGADRQAWEILHIAIQGNPDENAAKSANLLSYQ